MNKKTRSQGLMGRGCLWSATGMKDGHAEVGIAGGMGSFVGRGLGFIIMVAFETVVTKSERVVAVAAIYPSSPHLRATRPLVLSPAA